MFSAQTGEMQGEVSSRKLDQGDKLRKKACFEDEDFGAFSPQALF